MYCPAVMTVLWTVIGRSFMLALPIFPGSHPPSIVGADELNFCVRDGNRWTLIAINTNSYGWLFTIVYVKSASLLTPYMIAPFPVAVNSYFTAPVTRTIWSFIPCERIW